MKKEFLSLKEILHNLEEGYKSTKDNSSIKFYFKYCVYHIILKTIFFKLIEKKIDLNQVLYNLMLDKNDVNIKDNTLAIIPSPTYVDEIISILKNKFKKIYLIDNFRKGKIGQNKILTEQEFLTSIKSDKISLYFITSFRPDLIDYFKAKYKPNVDIVDILKYVQYEKYIDHMHLKIRKMLWDVCKKITFLSKLNNCKINNEFCNVLNELNINDSFCVDKLINVLNTNLNLNWEGFLTNGLINLEHSILEENFDIKGQIEKKLNRKVNNLGIYPPFTSIPPLLTQKFKKVIIYNNIDKENIFQEVDALLIFTQKFYKVNWNLIEQMPQDKLVFSHDLFITSIKSKRKNIWGLIRRINNSKNPLIFYSRRYYNNFTPLFDLLEKEGYEIFIIVNDVSLSHTGEKYDFYSIPFKNKFLITDNQLLELSNKINKGIFVIHSESFFNPGYNGFDILCSYILLFLILKRIKIQKILILYDIIKLIYDKFKYEKYIIYTYKKCLNHATKIILNSNTIEAVDFLKNFIKNKPMINFYRYNYHFFYAPITKIEDGFHIAMVGCFLDEAEDVMRMMSKYVKKILNQNIHVHYYMNIQGAKRFSQTLTSEQKKFFHIETPILDQRVLQKEISKYHAGWMVHNTNSLFKVMNSTNSQFLRDLLFIFLISTVPSSILLFGSVGLPIFINRSMTGLLNEFPKEFFIPIELSEISNLRYIIESIDWKTKYNILAKNTKFFTIEFNIKRLSNFLKSKLEETHM